MSDPYDAADVIRAAIGVLEKTHSRGRLAAMAGVSKSVMSDFLNSREKQPQIGMDKVTNLARSLKKPVLSLLLSPAAAPQPGSVNPPVTGVREVRVRDGSAEARMVELEGQNQALLEKVRAYEDALEAIEGIARQRSVTPKDRAPQGAEAKRRQRG
jgi:hypothetical protein